MTRVVFLWVSLCLHLVVRCNSKNALPTCGANEGWAHCKDTCNKSCDNLSGSGCVYLCEPGCDCLPNHVRNRYGVCIPVSECSQQNSSPFIDSVISVIGRLCPGQNEEYKECKDTCKKSCTNPQGTPVCNHRCLAGCDCKENYLRDESGKCVHKSQCHKNIIHANICTGENEEYKQCKDTCRKTCANPQGTGVCTYISQCDAGCDCKENFLRDALGRCVHKSQCATNAQGSSSDNYPGLGPPCIGENEIWTTCRYHCPQYCETRFENKSCMGCTPGCVCRPNYYRNSAGYCVHESQCPAATRPSEEQCYGPNEVFVQCKDTCKKSCAHPNGKGICTHECRPGCDCEPDYYRNPSGKCVHISNCYRYLNEK